MLVDKMRGIKANAAATERRSPLRSVTTASEGFDSTAVCVLAREIGIRKAITIIGREDGRGIGRQLGLKVVARHRAWSGWLLRSVSQEFYAMPVGHNRALGLFEQDLTDAVLFGGHSGDGIWSLEDYYQNLDLLYPAMNTVGALPLLEFRLRMGLVLVQVPAIGLALARRDGAIAQRGNARISGATGQSDGVAADSASHRAGSWPGRRSLRSPKNCRRHRTA